MTYRQIKRVAVIGAGIMGHGFAQVFAQSGCQVMLCDVKPSILNKALQQIRGHLRLFVSEGLLSSRESERILKRISTTVDLGTAAASADFVLEAVPELLPLKKEIFIELDRSSPGHALLASTTSAFSMTAISAGMRKPERALIAHGTNPPYIVPLVEILRGKKTSTSTVNRALRFFSKIKMRPVLVSHDTPGFIYNRLQFALFREALHCLEEGLAGPAEIDFIVRAGYGFRLAQLGPFETADLGGLDTFGRISKNLFPCLSAEKQLPRGFSKMLKAGKLGIKNGAGFYSYSPAEAKRKIRQRDKRLLAQLKLFCRSA